MMVRITGSLRASNWYADYIGYVFEVEQDSEYEEKWMVIKMPNLRGYLINKVDCEIFE